MTDRNKNLLVIAFVLIAVTMLAHYYFLADRIAANEGLKRANATLSTEILANDRSWKLDPDYLSQLNDQYQQLRNARGVKLIDVLESASKEFEPLIDPHGNKVTAVEWRKGILSLDYDSKFWAVKETLDDKGLHINEAILKLKSDQSVAMNRVYRLIAHLHVVERLAILATKNGLTLAHNEMTSEWLKKMNIGETTTEANKPPALLTVMPVRSYFVEGATEPFADEYPVAMRVRGSMRNLAGFLQALTRGSHFLPLDRFEIRPIGAEKLLSTPTPDAIDNLVEADLVCSGFLVLKDLEKLKTERTKKKQKKAGLPRGA